MLRFSACVVLGSISVMKIFEVLHCGMPVGNYTSYVNIFNLTYHTFSSHIAKHLLRVVQQPQMNYINMFPVSWLVMEIEGRLISRLTDPMLSTVIPITAPEYQSQMRAPENTPGPTASPAGDGD
jgi:hypothetical protein